MKITIQNFQPFANASFEASGFTAIVGPSNVGKSAAIRAVVSALFNRPGEEFVRNGHTISHVDLDELPGRGGAPHDVEWSKGHNVNQFKVDGELYNKVGLSAPQVLQDAGFRDIWIGDKDRSRGESIRPQVAGQFDSLFLIDRLGSFVSDVLSVISRLAVLLRAHQRSSTDLKSQKQMLGVRRKDLTEAETRLEAMAPITELHTRISDLAPKMEALKKDQELVHTDIKPLVTRRARLAPFVQLTIPDPVVVSPTLGDTYFALHALVTARASVLPLMALRIPDPAKAAKPEAVLADVEKFHALGALVAERRRYAPLQGADLPPTREYPLEKVDLVVKRVDTLRDLVAQKGKAYIDHFDAVRALKSARDEESAVAQELKDFQAELGVCPVCDQPMQVATASV